MRVVFIIYTILFIFLVTAKYKKSWKKYYLFIKTINSLGFLSVATWAMLQSGNTGFYLVMLPAFIFCLVGDVLLAVVSPKYKETCFLAGTISFLVGHICFLRVYYTIVPMAWYDFLFPAIMVLVTSWIIHRPGMNMKRATIPVLIYSFFVTMLFSKSAAIVFTAGFTSRNLLLMTGSLFFLISDFVLMLNYFYIRKFKYGPFLCSLFYYYGMFLLAISILL